MNNLVDIVQSIIDQIELDIDVKSVTGDKVFVCETTLHLTITKIVTINTLEYEVIDFDFNNWVQLKGVGHTTAIPSTTKIMTAPKIYFFHGDPVSTNAEYLELSTLTLNKTPFIWLLESYEYDDLPRDSSIDMAFDARIFGLDWANEKKWKNNDHNKNVIKPMQNLINAFVEVINEDFNFKSIGTVRTTVRPRFGVKLKEGSPKKKIIDEDLSGVDSKMKIEVYDASSCTCN